MVTCDKCKTVKMPSMGYWRSKGQMGFHAGSACPKCDPSRAVVQQTPAWWTEEMERRIQSKEAWQCS